MSSFFGREGAYRHQNPRLEKGQKKRQKDARDGAKRFMLYHQKQY